MLLNVLFRLGFTALVVDRVSWSGGSACDSRWCLVWSGAVVRKWRNYGTQLCCCFVANKALGRAGIRERAISMAVAELGSDRVLNPIYLN